MRSPRQKYKPIWEVDRIREFYNTYPLPRGDFALNKATVITDLEKFVESHIAIIEANNGNPTYSGFYFRLKKLKRLLTQQGHQNQLPTHSKKFHNKLL